jgi:predicted permease
MRLLSRFRKALINLFRKEEIDRELDKELESYVGIITDERIAEGMSRAEARRTALKDFGGMEQVKQAVRDRRPGAGIEALSRDVRYGFRQLIRNPGFTFTVIATLALSIGANTAVFSLVNALMLRSLPYPHPERLGTIFRQVQRAAPYDGRHQINGQMWEYLRDDVPSLLSAVSSGRADGVNLEADHHVDYVRAGRISAHYLDVLGVHPVLGRNFSEAEDRPHGPKAVILSYNLWRNIFDEDRSLIGQIIHLKGDSYTVVGVLPAGVVTPLDADLYTALQPSRDGEGGGSNYAVIVRLRDGATWQQADAEVNRAWSESARELAPQYGPGARVSFHTVPLQFGQTSALRPEVQALMSASAFILLIACANLAGLTLVRMARRTPEMATRLALGGSHWQIQRQLWIENLLLALAGGASGLLVGYLALRGLLALLPPRYLPVVAVHLDGAVLAFTFALSLLTSVFFGMLPAWTVRKLDLRSSMAAHAVTGSQGAGARQVLIAGEVALTVVLLAGSGLLIRTLIHLQTLPPGFNPNGVTTGKASLDDTRYHDPATFRKLLDESVAAMQRIPGVQDAAVGLSLPYERVLNDMVMLADGKETGREVQTDELYVTPDYFATLQIPVLAGRAFTNADGPDAQPVMIVNQEFVRKFYHGADPVGRTVGRGPSKGVIVGVVADVQISSGLNWIAPLQSEETVYIPAAQITRPETLALLHTWFQPSWIVRESRPLAGLTQQMQQALASVDPGLPFSGFYSMSDLQAQTLAAQRVQVALLGTMAGLALLLSAVGIFVLVANSVTLRTREIGIRIALGSSVSQAMRKLAGVGVRPAMIGLVLGLLGSAGALRVMRSILYGVGVYDAPSLLSVVGVLGGVAILAATLPALRIARIDPATTLREE